MRIWIREANGTLHEGVNIHGNGGIVTGGRCGRNVEGRLRLAIEAVEQGHDTGLYEPKPGHVIGYYAKWWGRAEERVIDLRGATIERVSDEPLPDIPPPAGYGLEGSCPSL